MIRKRSGFGICVSCLLGLGLLCLATPSTKAQSNQVTGLITKYDITTPDDLLFSRLVGPVMSGEISDWSKRLLGGMPAQFGDWVNQFIDATHLANIVTETFPVDGQPALKPVENLVLEMRPNFGSGPARGLRAELASNSDLHDQSWRPTSPRSHQWAAQLVRESTS